MKRHCHSRCVCQTRTAQTLAKSERGEDLQSFDSVDAMFKDLGI